MPETNTNENGAGAKTKPKSKELAPNDGKAYRFVQPNRLRSGRKASVLVAIVIGADQRSERKRLSLKGASPLRGGADP